MARKKRDPHRDVTPRCGPFPLRGFRVWAETAQARFSLPLCIANGRLIRAPHGFSIHKLAIPARTVLALDKLFATRYWLPAADYWLLTTDYFGVAEGRAKKLNPSCRFWVLVTMDSVPQRRWQRWDQPPRRAIRCCMRR